MCHTIAAIHLQQYDNFLEEARDKLRRCHTQNEHWFKRALADLEMARMWATQGLLALSEGTKDERFLLGTDVIEPFAD